MFGENGPTSGKTDELSLKACSELAGDECECERGMSIGDDDEGWIVVSVSIVVAVVEIALLVLIFQV